MQSYLFYGIFTYNSCNLSSKIETFVILTLTANPINQELIIHINLIFSNSIQCIFCIKIHIALLWNISFFHKSHYGAPLCIGPKCHTHIYVYGTEHT